MAAIPHGIRITFDTHAVNATALPRKRFRKSGFDNVKAGPYVAPRRPSNVNDRAFALATYNPPRMPLVVGRAQPADAIDRRSRESRELMARIVAASVDCGPVGVHNYVGQN